MTPLIISSTLSLYFLIYICFKDFAKYAEFREHGKFFALLSMFFNSLLFVLVQSQSWPTYVSYIMFLVLMLISFYFIFDTDFIYAYFGAIHFVFYSFVIRMGVMSLYSLITTIPIDKLKHSSFDFLLIYQIATIITIVLFLYWDNYKLTKDKMILVLRNRQELSFILTSKTILGLYMMIITYGSRYTLNERWFASVHLVTSIIVAFMAYSALMNGIQAAASLEHEKQTVALQNQLTMQINHYKAYQKYTESFREFRHDYKRMLSTINYLLRNDQYEEAIDILDEMGVVIASNDVAHIQYSNYPLLDAVLQEFANRCLGSNIEFSGVLYWDENIRLDELTIVRVFTNLLTNAYEACLEVDEEKRFIKLESKLREYWLDIRIANSYSGMIHEDLSSTKEQSERSRGLGTKIVRHTIEELGGVFSWNTKGQTFYVYLHIPRK